MNSKECKIYQYSQGFEQREVLFSVIMITVPDNFQLSEEDEANCLLTEWNGGPYAVAPATLESEGQTWVFLEKWRKKNKKELLKNQWVEECEHIGWELTGNIKCWYSVK
ncbi:MAG: hypothetical protein PUC65_14165 [Clostridiales bacterium]|nr:hypothetical protein [Clostridiales bacterium]